MTFEKKKNHGIVMVIPVGFLSINCNQFKVRPGSKINTCQALSDGSIPVDGNFIKNAVTYRIIYCNAHLLRTFTSKQKYM